MDINSTALQFDQPIAVAAPDTELRIVVDPATPLAVGTYVFRLVVVDNSNNQSAATQFRLVVRDSQLPTAVISGLEAVEFGAEILLSGRRSSDVPPGTIATYIWTLVAQ